MLYKTLIDEHLKVCLTLSALLLPVLAEEGKIAQPARLISLQPLCPIVRLRTHFPVPFGRAEEHSGATATLRRGASTCLLYLCKGTIYLNLSIALSPRM